MKIIQKFIDRDDLLSYLSVRFEPFEETDSNAETGLSDHIIKMTEKFEFNGNNNLSSFTHFSCHI